MYIYIYVLLWIWRHACIFGYNTVLITNIDLFLIIRKLFKK